MGIIDHQADAILLTEGDDLGQGSNITFHAEKAINNEQLAFIGREALQNTLQMVHIIVAEALNLAAGEEGAIDNAGMILFVEDDNVILANDRADRAEVDLHAGGIDQGSVLAHPGSGFSFKLFMQAEVAIEETRTGAAGAVAIDGVDGGLAHFGMGGQTKVIVRAAHDDAPAFVDDLGALVLIQGDEKGVVTLPFGFLHNIKIVTFLENIHHTIHFTNKV